MMHGRGKSDSVVVAVKPANKAARSAAELVEPRAGAEGNASQQSAHRAQDRESVSQALERIRHASPSSTQGESRMHQRARTDRGGGREVTRVPTATGLERGPLGRRTTHPPDGASSSPRPGSVRGNRCGHELHEGRRQTSRRSVYAGSWLKPIEYREGLV